MSWPDIPERLTEIDELLRLDHGHLQPDDECWSIWEYTPGKGFRHSPANQLVYNLKKGTELRETPQWYYKEKAIEFSGQAIARFIADPSIAADLVFVPTPPSAAKGDPRHDDRMLRVLHAAKAQLPWMSVHESVVQPTSMPASHLSDHRHSVAELVAAYEFIGPVADAYIVVDDMLTLGTHFRAMKTAITAAVADATVYGLFLTRRVHDTAPASASDIWGLWN